MIIKCQLRRKTTPRRRWALASRSFPQRTLARASWMGSHRANQTGSKIYSSQLRICSATTSCNLVDHKTNLFSQLQKKVQMSRLKSSKVATQSRTTPSKVTISKQSSEGPTCSIKFTVAMACRAHYSVATITKNWIEAKRKTNEVNSISRRPSNKVHSKSARPLLASSGPTARAPR